MAEGTPSGEHFGFPAVPASGDGAPDPLSDTYEEDLAKQTSPPPSTTPGSAETPAQEEPAAEAAPAGTEPPASTEPPAQGKETAPPAGEEVIQAGEQPPASEERLYAGRYKSIEDLEAGYKHIQALQKRTAESQRELTERATRADQLEEYLRRAAPIIRQYQEAQQRGQLGAPGEEFDPTDSEQVQRAIDLQVQQRMAAERQTLTQQTQQQMELQRREQVLNGFAAAHPEVMGTPLEDDVADIVATIVRETEQPITTDTLEVALELANQPRLRQMVDDLYADPTDPNMLQAAKDALEHPALAEIYLAMPDLTKSPGGQAWAKKQAQLPQLVSTAQAQAQGRTPTPEQQRAAAHVEHGGSGAPAHGAPGARPDGDEFDEAAAAWKDGHSLFGFGS